MAKTVKQAKADIYLRDTDSQSLFNNSGELSFKYFHEWNDCYDKTTGRTAQIDGETYDESTGTYKPNCPDGHIPVFNGRLSALWDNMVSCFPDRIKSMYVTMRGNGLSYKDMLMKYKEFWRYWCENLYNADAFGYANTGNFDKAFGDKLQMMDFFFQKRQRYLDSKYCCGSSVSNHLRMRLSEVGKGFAIKYYQAIYSSLQWAVGSFATQRNIEPGTYSYMPWKMEGSPQDTTFDIDDADLITELSTYTKTSSGYAITGLEGVGNFKFDSDMGILKRLTKFIMNYTVAKPNTNELGAHFDLSGMTLLRQVVVRNVKNLTNSIVLSSDIIEEVDFTGTPIVGVSTPPSDSLARLVLPSSVTALRLKGYTNLKSSGLQIAGYSNIDVLEVEDCPNLNSYDILKACYDAGAPLTDVTLRGVEWTLESADLLVYLAERKATLQGRVTVKGNVTFAQKRLMTEAWGDVDDEGGVLYVGYERKSVSSVSLSGISHMGKTGEWTLTVTPNPVTGNDFRGIEWGITENDYATIDSRTGVLEVRHVGTSEESASATVTATVTLGGGETVSAEKTVYFCRREMAVGDVVYADGSYSPQDDIDKGKTVVAVCCYISASDKSDRRGVGVQNVATYRQWGLTSRVLPGIKLADDPAFNVYDVRGIDLVLNKYNQDDYKADDYETPLTLKRDILDYGKGETVTRGQYNTLCIVEHCQTILADSNVNLPVPAATDGETELGCLNRLCAAVVAQHNGDNKAQYYQEYYFPQAYSAYAYEPTVRRGERLAANFEAHRWYLPSAGELALLLGLKQSYFPLNDTIGSSTEANSGDSYHVLAGYMQLAYSKYTMGNVYPFVRL